MPSVFTKKIRVKACCDNRCNNGKILVADDCECPAVVGSYLSNQHLRLTSCFEQAGRIKAQKAVVIAGDQGAGSQHRAPN